MTRLSCLMVLHKHQPLHHQPSTQARDLDWEEVMEELEGKQLIASLEEAVKNALKRVSQWNDHLLMQPKK